MALELTVWLIIIGIGLLGYFLGMSFKLPHLFLFGSILTALSGALLFIFDGLIVGHYYSEVGGLLSLSDITITYSNIGLSLLTIVLIAIPIISFLIIDFGGTQTKTKSAFHY